MNAYLLCGFGWFSKVLPEMMHYRLEDQLPRVHASSLVLHGENDMNCPPEWVRDRGEPAASSRSLRGPRTPRTR